MSRFPARKRPLRTCGSSKPRVSWQELSSAWCVNLPSSLPRPEITPKPHARLATRASPAVLIGTERVAPIDKGVGVYAATA